MLTGNTDDYCPADRLPAIEAMNERVYARVNNDLYKADWRQFTTMVRFAPVYHRHFKCNRKWLREYPNLWGWTRALDQSPGVAKTVDFAHIVRHYHHSHAAINPCRIIPVNPLSYWTEGTAGAEANCRQSPYLFAKD